MKRCIVFAIIMELAVLQPVLYAAEKTFSFGKPPFEETAKITVQKNNYIVTCSFKPLSKIQSDEMQSMFHEQKAKGICLKAIASYRKGKKVSRCSATVRGLSLLKEPKKSGEELVFVYTVPVDGVIEKNIQTVK